jgi:hypothetical protein
MVAMAETRRGMAASRALILARAACSRASIAGSLDATAAPAGSSSASETRCLRHRGT